MNKADNGTLLQIEATNSANERENFKKKNHLFVDYLNTL